VEGEDLTPGLPEGTARRSGRGGCSKAAVLKWLVENMAVGRCKHPMAVLASLNDRNPKSVSSPSYHS